MDIFFTRIFMKQAVLEKKKTLLFATAINILLSAGKAIGGVLGNSSALLADALDSLTDLVGDVIVILGVWVAGKPADEQHQFGHYKAESIVTVVAGLLIVGAALSMLVRSISLLISNETPYTQPWTAFVALWSILTCTGMYFFLDARARKHNSPGLGAAAAHKLADAGTSVAALAGIVLSTFFDIHWGDAAASGIVSIWIIRTGVKIILRGGHELLDGATELKMDRQIFNIAQNVSGVSGVHGLKTRSAGGKIFAEMDISISDNLSVADGHVIAHRVRDRLTREMPHLADVIVHIEPAGGERAVRNSIISQSQKILSMESELRSFHGIDVLPSQNGFILVVDVVVSPDITVRHAHMICESLRKRLLDIPKLSDAIIHIDYQKD